MSTDQIAVWIDKPLGFDGELPPAWEDSRLTLSVVVDRSITRLTAFDSYQWQRSINGSTWTNIESAEGFTYLPTDIDVGHVLRARFRYTLSTGSTGELFTTPTWPVENVNDLPNWAQLRLSVVPKQGLIVETVGTVTDADNSGVKAGVIDPASFSYQWLAGGVPIDGAVGAQFIPGQSEVGKILSVNVSFIDNFGTLETTVLSAGVATANTNDSPEGTVWISGDATQYETLTASWILTDADGPITIAPSSVSWQWFSDGTAIPGVQSSTLILSQSHVGRAISVRLRYVDGFGFQENVLSEAFGPVANVDDLPVGTVAISGTAVQGSLLTATAAVSDLDGIPLSSGGSAPTIDWYVDSGEQVGVGATLLLTQNLVGQSLRARYSYVDLLGSPSEVWSASLGPIADRQDPPQGSMQIVGELIEGATLSIVHDVNDADSISGEISFQWFANGQSITGEVGTELLLTQALVGKSISAQLSYLDGLNKVETVSATAVGGSVRNIQDDPTGSVWIEGEVLQQKGVLRAVHDLMDTDGIPVSGQPGAITYQWFLDGQILTGERFASLVLTQRHVGGVITVALAYTDLYGQGYNFTAAGVGAIENLNDSPQSSLSIQGISRQGQLLSVFGEVVDLDIVGQVSQGDLRYQWTAAGEPIAEANGAQFQLTQQEVGKAISVEVRYFDPFGFEELIILNANGVVENIDDPATGAIELVGELLEGQVIEVVSSVTDLDLTPPDEPSLTFTWFADGAIIDGHDEASLTLGPAQVGRSLRVQATYKDVFGLHSVLSAASVPVRNINDLPQGDLSISGSAIEGATLRAIGDVLDLDGIPLDGSMNPAYNYQWLANGEPIVGANGPSLTLVQALVGSTIALRVSYTDSNQTAEEFFSASVGPVIDRQDSPIGSVRIDGDLIEHQTLTAVADFFDPDGMNDVSWFWFAEGGEIAQGETLRLTDALIGKRLSVSAQYVDGLGEATTVSANSGNARVKNFNDPVEAELSVDGPIEQGSTIKLNFTLADLDGVPDSSLISVQWTLDGLPIPGATSSVMALNQSHVGGALGVRLSFVDGRGTPEVFVSPAFRLVANVPDDPIGSVSITGLARVGSVLEVTTSLTDPDGISGPILLQWMTEEGPIPGATGSRLLITPDLVGHQIGLAATWTDDGGDNEWVETWHSDLVSSLQVRGRVFHWRDEAPIEGAEVTLFPTSSGSVNSRFTQTDSAGLFAFEGLDFDSYVIQGVFSSPLNAAVDGADLLALMKMATGRNPNSDPDGPGPAQASAVSPFQRVAADLDFNGVVNSLDVATLLNWGSHRSEYPAVWRLVDASMAGQASAPISATFDSMVNVAAVLLGDIDGGWYPQIQ
jgi:hypothetical protein